MECVFRGPAEGKNASSGGSEGVGKTVGKAPAKVVRAGNVTVKIYAREIRRGDAVYQSFQVADYTSGRRRFRTFADEEQAIREATRIARALAGGNSVAAGMTSHQAAAFGRAQDLLRGTGIPLEIAAATVAEACALLGGNRIVEAARYFVDRQLLDAVPKSVSDTVDEFLHVRESRGLAPRSMKDLRGRLRKFAQDINCSIQSIGSDVVQRWLDGLRLSPQSYRNYRTVLHTLFEHAKARRYIRENPVQAVERIKVRVDDIAVFSPEEMERLLSAARRTNPKFVPVLALGAFAGIRTAEILRLTWEDIDFADDTITLNASQSKLAVRRMIPMASNLRQWLETSKSREGPIWPFSEIGLHKSQEACAEETETSEMPAVKWRSNALRHSFGSYRFAVLQDAGRVAAEMGNSPKMVYQRYRKVVKTSTAEQWFSLLPTGHA